MYVFNLYQKNVTQIDLSVTSTCKIIFNYIKEDAYGDLWRNKTY